MPTFGLPALKINPKLPLESLHPRFPLIKSDLTFAFQFPSKLHKKHVPYGKIIKTLFSTKPLEMVPGFPVPIPEIVFMTGGSIFPAAFDSYFLKIVNEKPMVISQEGFLHAGFYEI